MLDLGGVQNTTIIYRMRIHSVSITLFQHPLAEIECDLSMSRANLCDDWHGMLRILNLYHRDYFQPIFSHRASMIPLEIYNPNRVPW